MPDNENAGPEDGDETGQKPAPENGQEPAPRVEAQHVRELSSTGLIVLGGHLEHVQAKELSEAVLSLLGQGITKIIFDMSDVEYMNSSVIAALANCAAATEGHGGKSVLLALSTRLRTVLETLGLLGMFLTAETREEAIQVLS